MSFGSGGMSFGSGGLQSLPSYGSMDLLGDLDHDFGSDCDSDSSDGDRLDSPHIGLDGLQLHEVLPST